MYKLYAAHSLITKYNWIVIELMIVLADNISVQR